MVEGWKNVLKPVAAVAGLAAVGAMAAHCIGVGPNEVEEDDFEGWGARARRRARRSPSPGTRRNEEDAPGLTRRTRSCAPAFPSGSATG